MSIKVLRFKMPCGSIPRRVLLRAMMIVCAFSAVAMLQVFYGDDERGINPISCDECAMNLSFLGPFILSASNLLSNGFLKPAWRSVVSVKCEENINATANAVRELISMKMLSYDANALCVGRRSISAVLALKEQGISNAHAVYKFPFLSFEHRKLMSAELDYSDSSFDFVFSSDIENVAVPAWLMLEIERVLKPGGIWATLVNTSDGSDSNSLIRSITPVSSLLKNSTVVHVARSGELALVVFRRNADNTSWLHQNQNHKLPASCPSIINNRAYIDFLEPLLEENDTKSQRMTRYLPEFINLSSKKRLVYINIRAAENLKPNTSWFFPSYPVDSRAFTVYFVDHNTSVMTSYVKRPGINFVYHPGLAETKSRTNAQDLEPIEEDDDGFDFLAWFKETVSSADFVVLKMNTSEPELQFLSELLNTGAICFVDELFLHCTGHKYCTSIFKSLRHSGLFVHQWWDGDS